MYTRALFSRFLQEFHYLLHFIFYLRTWIQFCACLLSYSITYCSTLCAYYYEHYAGLAYLSKQLMKKWSTSLYPWCHLCIILWVMYVIFVVVVPAASPAATATASSQLQPAFYTIDLPQSSVACVASSLYLLF